MHEQTSERAERAIGGDPRIHIRQGARPLLPDLIGRAGTVVEVFRVPRDSCLVRIDGDPNQQREWFFYRDEVVLSEA